jgi:uncharacterized protein (TIGR00725 family)
MNPYVGVIGAGTDDPVLDAHAEVVGDRLAQAGAVVVCGGLGGVMAAACRGAAGAGGLTIGLLPGTDRASANPWVGVAIATGLGELRNALIVRTSDVLIAIGGEYGTLSEVALGLKAGRPVVGLGTWQLVGHGGVHDSGIVPATSAEHAVELALALTLTPTKRLQ